MNMLLQEKYPDTWARDQIMTRFISSFWILRLRSKFRLRFGVDWFGHVRRRVVIYGNVRKGKDKRFISEK